MTAPVLGAVDWLVKFAEVLLYRALANPVPPVPGTGPPSPCWPPVALKCRLARL